MGRPAKTISTNSRHNTKKDVEIRKAAEEKARGGMDKLIPPRHLTKEQKVIYKYIVDNLKEAEILGNLDHYILAMTAVTIDSIIQFDKAMNQVDDIMKKSKLIAARTNLAKDFFRCCNELSLSPQARAKISIANVKAIRDNQNPLLEVLGI